jgi:hypothetical protein
MEPLKDQLPAKPVGSYHIKEISVSGSMVNFDLLCGVPDPCHIYAWTEHSISGNAVDVTVYARPESNGPCITVVGSIETNLHVSVPQPGEYLFKFHPAWISKDTLITVPEW